MKKDEKKEVPLESRDGKEDGMSLQESSVVADSDGDIPKTDARNEVGHISNKFQETVQQKSRVRSAKKVFIISLSITLIFALLSLAAMAAFVYFIAPTTMGVAMVSTIGILSAVFIFVSIFVAFYISFELRGVKEKIEEFQHELGEEPLLELQHEQEKAQSSTPQESVAIEGVGETVSPILPAGDVSEEGKEARTNVARELQEQSNASGNNSVAYGKSARFPQQQRIDQAATVSTTAVGDAKKDSQGHDVHRTTDAGAHNREQSELNTQNKTLSQKVTTQTKRVTFAPDTTISQRVSRHSASASDENMGIVAASPSSESNLVVQQKTDEQVLQLDTVETAASVAMRREEEGRTYKQIHVSDGFLRVYVPEKDAAVAAVRSSVRAYVRINTDNSAAPADKTKLKEILSSDATHNLSYRYNKTQNKFYVAVNGLRFEVDNITLFTMGREPTDDEISELRKSLSGKEQVLIELTYSSPCIPKKGDLGLYETTGYAGGECTAEFLSRGYVDMQQSYGNIYLTLMSYNEFQEKPWKLSHARQFISYCRDEMFSVKARDINVKRCVASMIMDNEMAFKKIGQRKELTSNYRNIIGSILDNAGKLRDTHIDVGAVEEVNSRLCLMHSMFSRDDEVFEKLSSYNQRVTYEFIVDNRFRETVSLLAMQAVHDKIVADPEVKITPDDFPYICRVIPGLTDAAFYFMRACLHPTKTYDVLDDHMMSLCTIGKFKKTETGKLCATQKADLLLEEKDSTKNLMPGEQALVFDVLSNIRVRVHTPENTKVSSRDEVIDSIRKNDNKELSLDTDGVFHYINSGLSHTGRRAAIAESFSGAVKSILNGKDVFPIVSGKPMRTRHYNTVSDSINALLLEGDSGRFKNLLHYNPYRALSFAPHVGESKGVLLSPEFDTTLDRIANFFSTSVFSRISGKQKAASPESVKAVASTSDVNKPVVVDSASPVRSGASPTAAGGKQSEEQKAASPESVKAVASTSDVNKPVVVDSASPVRSGASPTAAGGKQYGLLSEKTHSIAADTAAVRVPSSDRTRETFTLSRVVPYASPKDAIAYASDHQLIENHTEFTLFIRTQDTNIQHIDVQYPVQKVDNILMSLTFTPGGLIRNKSLRCTVGSSSINVLPDRDGFCMVLVKGDPGVVYDDAHAGSECRTVMFRFYADINADLVNIPSDEEIGIKPKLIPLFKDGKAIDGKCVLGLNAVDTPVTREVLLSEMVRLTPLVGSYEDGYHWHHWSNDMAMIYGIYHNTIAKDGVSLQAVADATTHGNKFFAFLKNEKVYGVLMECFSSIGRYKKKYKNNDEVREGGTPQELLALAYSMSRTGGNSAYTSKAVVDAKSDGKLLVKFLSDDKFRNLVISAVFSHVLMGKPEYVRSRSPLASEQFPLLFRQIPGLTSCVKSMVNVVFPPKQKFSGNTDFLYPVALLDRSLVRKACYGKDIDKLEKFVSEVDKIAGSQPIAVFAFFLKIAAKNVASDDKLEPGERDHKILPFECESLEVLKHYVSCCERGDVDSVIKVMESSYDVLIHNDASRDVYSESESTRSNSVTLRVLQEIMTYAIVKYVLGRFNPKTELGMRKNMCDFLSSADAFRSNLQADVARFVASEDFTTTTLFTEHFPEKIGVTRTVTPYCCTTLKTLCPPEKKEAIITEASVCSEDATQERTR